LGDLIILRVSATPPRIFQFLCFRASCNSGRESFPIKTNAFIANQRVFQSELVIYFIRPGTAFLPCKNNSLTAPSFFSVLIPFLFNMEMFSSTVFIQKFYHHILSKQPPDLGPVVVYLISVYSCVQCNILS